MGVVKAKFEVDYKNGVAGINAFTKALQSVGKVSNETKRGVDVLAHSVQAFAGGVKAMSWVKDQIKPFIQANANYEKLQIQLTGLIATNTKNIDSMGKSIDAAKKWALSTKEAHRVLQELNKINLKTKFTLDEVAQGFNMFYVTASNQ